MREEDLKGWIAAARRGEKGETEWAVKRLRNNRSRGPSRMQAEHLKGWLAVARRGEKGENADKEGGGREDTREGAENWARVVELVQTAFRDGDLAEEATCQAVVLIPKGIRTTGALAMVSGQVAERGLPSSRPSCYNIVRP